MINLTTVGYRDRTIKSIMDVPRNHFYVTLFSNGSKEVFPENTLTAFTIQLAQPVDLGLSDWEVGLAELSHKAPHPKLFKGKCVDVHSSESALVYCNLIAPQEVGTERGRILRTVPCPVQSRYHLFEKIHYIQVEKKTLSGHTH